MKRFFAAALIAVLALSLCACGQSDKNDKQESTASQASVASEAESKTESKTESTASDAQGESELKTIYERVKQEVTLPDNMSDFTAARVKRVFGITEDEMTDFAGAVCTDGITQDQIIYVKAKDEDSAKAIAEKLQNNWQATYNVIKNYDPDQMTIIENAKVETNGLYVSLVMTAEADQVKSIFNEALK